MQGPFDLKQGGQGIAIRNPVYLEGADGSPVFWGFTIVIIRVPEIFTESIQALTKFGYDYSLTKTALELVKKHKIALFLYNGTKYVRIKKSDALTLSMNPVETEYDYIADESPTTEVEDYKPSIDQNLVMYKGSEDYEMMWPYYYERRTGDAAHTKCMIVFMQEPGTDGGYKAWETDSTISMQDLAAVDKKLDFKIIFGGGITNGTATMTDGTPTFTADK